MVTTTLKAAKLSKPARAAKSVKAAKPAKASAKVAPKAALSEKARPVKTPAARPLVTPEQRRNYIEVAAYYIAERRGFCGAGTHDDWVQAEAEIDRLLSAGKLNS